MCRAYISIGNHLVYEAHHLYLYIYILRIVHLYLVSGPMPNTVSDFWRMV